MAAGAISVTIPKATLTLATFVPTIRLAIRVTPNAVSLITSPQVPTVTASDHQRVTPTTKALALATFAPTVTTPAPQLVTPTTAALVATKYAPVVGTRYYAAVQATAPLAWWRLGEPSGTVSDDEIGSANADYINTPTLGVASLLSGDTNTSVTFSRASLEHTSANTNMPAGSSAGFSAKGWVRFATVTAATRYPVVRWFGGTGAPDTQLYYNVAVGAWRYLYQDATGFRNTHSDAWTPSTATTYFIVVTHDYSAETVKFYVNGALLSTEDVSVNGVPVVHAAGSSASVGRAASDYWDGTLDEVALYNGVLTPTQVLALYNAGSGAAGPQLVTPATASLVVTKYQPTVSAPERVTPTTKALTLAAFAPTIRLHQLVTPATKALTVTRYEPTVRLHQLVTPAKATLTITRFAPSATTPIRAVPGTKALALTPFAPVVTAGNVQSVTPTTAAILLTKYVPTVSVTAHLAVVPPAATLTVTKFAPAVSATAHMVVTPAVKSLIVAPQVPTVALTAHVAVIVPKATLTITRYAPSLEQTNDQVAIPTTKSLTLSALTPTVTATANVAFVPTAATLTITKFAPSVRTPLLATPAVKALSLTRFAPQARTPLLATPAKKTLTLDGLHAGCQLTCSSNAGNQGTDDHALCTVAGSAADNHRSAQEPRYHDSRTHSSGGVPLHPDYGNAHNGVIRAGHQHDVQRGGSSRVRRATDHRIPANVGHQRAPGDRSRNRRPGHHAIPANGRTALDHPATGPHLRLCHRGNGRLSRGRNRKRGCYCTQRGRRHRRAHIRA